MKNILMVIPQLKFGGAERDFCKLSIELAKQHRVYVCVFNREHDIDFPFGGSLLDLSVGGGGNILQKARNFIRRVKALKSIKRKFSIHTTISYLEGANYVNVLSRSNDKVIISARGSQLYDETIKGITGWFRKNVFIRLLYPKADKLIALSYGIKKELIDYYKIPDYRIYIIRNYFDIRDIERKSNDDIDNHLVNFFNNFVICTAGRLAPEKGYFRLIDIVSEARKHRTNIKLLIIGDGILRYRLFDHAIQSGLNPCAPWDKERSTNIDDCHLLFTGYQSNPFRFIAKSNLFTITSSSEGGPNILSEAMICRVPVVSVDCPSGPREKISTKLDRPIIKIIQAEYSDYGILMPTLDQDSISQSTQEWVKVILSLAANKDILTKYADRASQMISNYDISLLGEEWEKVI